MRRFKQAVDSLDYYAGVDKLDVKIQSAKFIDGLDQHKYADMQRNLFNESLGGEDAYPSTLSAAMTRAQQYLIPKISGPGSSTAAAFIASSKRKPKGKVTSDKSANKRNKQKMKATSRNHRETKRPVICWRCRKNDTSNLTVPKRRRH
jgi:hypothetical protein